MRSLLSLTLIISLMVAAGLAPKPANADSVSDEPNNPNDPNGDVAEPLLYLNSTPQDYIDAYGLPVDMNEYAWGIYAKKPNTAARATKIGLLHHSRGGKHAHFLSRQAQCTPFQTTCPLNGGCCPNTKVCCLGVIAAGNCCNPGQICIGATTCCDQNQTGCGEACCNSGQECCGLKCCNTSNGFQCTNSDCIAVSSSSISSTTGTSLSSSSSSLSSSSTRTGSSATISSTGDSFDSANDNSKPSMSKITTIVGAVAGISIALGVVVYLTRRNRQRRKLAKIQGAAQGHNIQQPPPNSVAEPMYQTASTSWAQPTQALATPTSVPLYYADHSNTASMLSLQNQQQPYHASEFSRQPSTAARSQLNSTSGGSSDYHAQPWAIPMPTQGGTQPANTPWMEGSGAPGLWSGEISGTGLGRQNTKARYITAAQREKAATEPKQWKAQTVGMNGVGGSSTTAISTSNAGSVGWATDDFGPADPPVTGAVPDLPPPAYSEYQPRGVP